MTSYEEWFGLKHVLTQEYQKSTTAQLSNEKQRNSTTNPPILFASVTQRHKSYLSTMGAGREREWIFSLMLTLVAELHSLNNPGKNPIKQFTKANLKTQGNNWIARADREANFGKIELVGRKARLHDVVSLKSGARTKCESWKKREGPRGAICRRTLALGTRVWLTRNFAPGVEETDGERKRGVRVFLVRSCCRAGMNWPNHDDVMKLQPIVKPTARAGHVWECLLFLLTILVYRPTDYFELPFDLWSICSRDLTRPLWWPGKLTTNHSCQSDREFLPHQRTLFCDHFFSNVAPPLFQITTHKEQIARFGVFAMYFIFDRASKWNALRK